MNYEFSMMLLLLLLLLPARLILLSKVTPTRPDETGEYTFYIRYGIVYASNATSI